MLDHITNCGPLYLLNSIHFMYVLRLIGLNRSKGHVYSGTFQRQYYWLFINISGVQPEIPVGWFVSGILTTS